MITGLALHPFKFLQSPKYIGRINYHTVFYGPYERAFFKAGNVTVNSVHFSKTWWAVQNYYKVNTLITDVSPPDDEGYMYYGAMGVAINSEAEAVANKFIVQVNKFQPRVKGMHHRIHVSKVNWICEHDHPLPPLPQESSTDVDQHIADHIVEQIPDGATIQIGLGALSNAVGYKLAAKKNLGVHTEMFVDSMVELAKKGVINGKMVAGFALGSQEVYDFVENVELKPLRMTNDPNEIAKVDKLMSINVTLMADLTGQACSESVGFFQYSSTGGQSDFARGCGLNPTAKSFLCVPSTIKKKDGTVISTITAALPPGAIVTTQRTDVMNIVTEYGIANRFPQAHTRQGQRHDSHSPSGLPGPAAPRGHCGGIDNTNNMNHGTPGALRPGRSIKKGVLNGNRGKIQGHSFLPGKDHPDSRENGCADTGVRERPCQDNAPAAAEREPCRDPLCRLPVLPGRLHGRRPVFLSI